MRHLPMILIAAVLLLSACGTPQTAQPAAQATNPPAALPPTAAEPTTAPPTEAPSTATPIAATSAPAATAAATTQPSVPPATAEPTARLILPAATSEASEAAPASAVPSADAPPPNSTAAPRASPTTAPKPAATSQPAAAPAAASAPSQPVRLEIPELGVDGRLASVGLDENRIPIVPKHDIAWYNLSAQPGAGENIVLWGHVLRFKDTPNIPAPFARLKELKPGATVLLYDKNGGEHRYSVTQQIWVKPDQVEYILPRGREMVTMVSCIGDKVITGGEVVDMSNRLITIAEPVG